MQYLANLLAAGKEEPIVLALKRLIAMRAYQRSVHVEGKADLRPLEEVGLSEEQAKAMGRYLAIANDEDRFVIPTGKAEMRMDDSFGFQGQNGFAFGNDASNGTSANTLFPQRRKTAVEVHDDAP